VTVNNTKLFIVAKEM